MTSPLLRSELLSKIAQDAPVRDHVPKSAQDPQGPGQAVAVIDADYQQALDPDSGEFLMRLIGVMDNTRGFWRGS